MSVTATRPETVLRLWLFAILLAGLAACSRKKEEARSVPEAPSAATDRQGAEAPEAPPAAAAGETPAPEIPGNPAARVEETVTQVPRSDLARAVPAGKPVFRNKPEVSAWPGRPYAFQPALTVKRPFTLKLIDGPEGMAVSGTAVAWTPTRPGSFPVTLEAAFADKGADSAKGRLAFLVEVKPVLTLALKPLPERAEKGDTVAFDLRGSTYPGWAAASLTVRFDYEGDGTWDTQGLPLASHLQHRHAFASVGRFAPKVEARYLDLETRVAEGGITITSAVDARLVLKPDTAEPGGLVSVDASGSKGDGRLTYLLDLDGDGKVDWSDSSTGRASLKAPASGRYEAKVLVRNSMGLEGKASAALLVNARPVAALKVRNAKENMAAPVEVSLQASDGDDSLRSLRMNFTGIPDAWQAASRPDSAKGPGRWRKTFKHAYGKTGKFTVEGCAASADGRESCQKSQVEIFNAPPEVEAGAAVKATLGVPAEIVGVAKDPDGSIVKWEWDLNGDGKYDVASRKDGKVKYTFAKKGTFSLNLRVTTADGMTAVSARQVEVRKKW